MKAMFFTTELTEVTDKTTNKVIPGRAEREDPESSSTPIKSDQSSHHRVHRVSQGKSELGEGAIPIKTISAVSRRVRRGPQRKPANG